MTLPAVSQARSQAARKEGVGYFRLVQLSWLLWTFAPQKLITTHFADLRVLTWIPELLLIALVLMIPARKYPFRGYGLFTAFFGAIIISTGYAYFYGATFVAEDALRKTLGMLGLCFVTCTECRTEEQLHSLLKIYFYSLIWWGLWAIYGLYHDPIVPGVDPGLRPSIYWSPFYDNRDAFGPLMAVGFFFVYYYAGLDRKLNLIGLFALAICISGILISFGRGVFLSLAIVGGMIWLTSNNKMKAVLSVFAFSVVLLIFFPNVIERYMNYMSTIVSNGTTEGTSGDRMVLWSWALRVFELSPLIGVGPRNFGINAVQIVSPTEAFDAGYTMGMLWGRALHSVPFTILSEQGLLGIAIAIALARSYFSLNSTALASIRSGAAASGSPSASDGTRWTLLGGALGLRAAFAALLINICFYELLYYPIIWQLLILNRAMFFVATAQNEAASLHGMPVRAPASFPTAPAMGHAST